MSNTTILIQHRNMILKYGLNYLPDHIHEILMFNNVVIQSLYDYFPSLLRNYWFKNQYGAMIKKRHLIIISSPTYSIITF